MPIYTRATHHLAQVGTGFEPQRIHNWSVEIPDLNENVNYMLAMSLVQGFLPTCYNEEVPMPYGNEVVYVAGQARWEMGALLCRDFIDRPATASLLNWRKSVYNPDNGAIGLAANYKKEVNLLLSGPDVQEEATDGAYGLRGWTLHGCWPIRVRAAAQGLDMTSSGIVMAEVALRYDRATAINYSF